ncbi:MAG: hypothetical protein JRI97_13170, partial [Deltaproteobacteria bacterium]|nr:hypothetical protein [Deltaproteobacteria bacterium]
GMFDAATRPSGLPTVPDWAPGPEKYGLRSLQNYRAADLPDFDESRLLPAGKSDEFYAAEFEKLYGEKGVVLADALGEPVILSKRMFQVAKGDPTSPWKWDKPGHGESLPLLRKMLERPLEVWLTPQQYKDGRWRLAKRYITAWKTEDKTRVGGLAVMEVADGCFQGVTGYLPVTRAGKPKMEYLNRQRRGFLAYPKKK